MNPRETDPAVLIPQVGLSTAPMSAIAECIAVPTADGLGPGERLDYVPVPPRGSHTVLVRVRAGDRLKPLPYPLDEEES